MAKLVGYWQDNYEGLYSEGPFVLCELYSSLDVRIEQAGPKCPIEIHESIRALLNREGDPFGTLSRPFLDVISVRGSRKKLEPITNWLNKQVHEKRIIEQNGAWICPEHMQ